MANHVTLQDLPIKTNRFDNFRKVKHQAKSTPTGSPGAIAKKMRSEGQNTGSIAFAENETIAAGYTFLGQWLAHDITSMRNIGVSTPQLRLTSLYGTGPSAMTGSFAHYPDDFDDPAMYCKYVKRTNQYDIFRHAKFKLKYEGGDQYDVPRLENKIAMMADTRNDQNFVICQLHCAFARFHNALVDWLHFVNYPYALRAPNGAVMKGQQLYVLAREIAIWCYQRILVEDYLPLHVNNVQLIKDLFNQPLAYKLFDQNQSPQLMPEFSMAAMRLGHSQIKEVYQLNGAGDRFILFSKAEGTETLGGFNTHKSLNFEWDVFFDLKTVSPQPSGAIDHWIARPLYEMPFRPAGANNLAAINLERSELLPTGEFLASQLQFNGLTPGGVFGNTNLPLWLYILLEAEQQEKAERLGQLGSQIIAEQIMWVLRHDMMSSYSEKGTCRTINGFADELFDKYPLEKFFGHPDVLKESLLQLGMGNGKMTMPWLIRFPALMEEKMIILNKEMEKLRENGPANSESAVHKMVTKPEESTQGMMIKWLELAKKR